MIPPPPNRPWILAHRGYHRRHRENTIAAFDAAMEVGADGIEFDVRSLGDGTLIVHHDRDLRVRGRRRLLRSLQRGEKAPWMPTFHDVVAWASAHPRAVLDVEVKEADLTPQVVRLVQEGGLVGRTVLTSFDPEALVQAQRLAPDLAHGLLLDKTSSLEDMPMAGPPRLLVLKQRLLRFPADVVAIREHHDLWAWGVSTQGLARTLYGAGVTGLISDRPDRLVDWPAPNGRRRRSPDTGRRGS